MSERIPVPKTLSKQSQTWFKRVATDFEFESHDLPVLELAARSWDRAEEARAILEREGLTITDAAGQVKPHPCVAIERDSQLRFAKFVKDLRLDDVDAPDTRR